MVILAGNIKLVALQPGNLLLPGVDVDKIEGFMENGVLQRQKRHLPSCFCHIEIQ